MKKLLLFLLICFTFSGFSQVIPEDVKPPSWKQNLNLSKSFKPFKLPAFDVQKLINEDIVNDKDKSKPWRFGHDIYVDHDFKTHGTWTTMKNGDKLWRMSYKSEGAHTLNIMFDEFYLPEGATLYVYNNAKNDLLRPFTHHNNSEEEVLGTWLVEGNQIWIEYHQPANVQGKARLRVGSVIHGYRTAESMQKALNDSGACNQDVDCDITPSGSDPFLINTRKEEVKTSSAMMVVGGNGFCSGTLVNNTNNDGTPYFLTANHCGSGEAGWAFRFNWRSPNPSCSTFANSTNGSFNQTVSGAAFRAASSRSDMKLVLINDSSFFTGNPNNLVWAGWNRSTVQLPQQEFGVHHPSGDIQKTCRDDNGAARQVVNFNGDPNTQVWFINDWELGVTEPGSSGSGLFNQDGHLIGMLSGGSAACSGTSVNGFDFYGRFGVAWSFGSANSQQLQFWLDPAGSNPLTLDQFPPLTTFSIDARASSGTNEAEICSDDFTPQVTIINQGTSNLVSANVSYFIDSDAPTVVNWSGNLSQGQNAVVATPTYSNLSPGSHTFTVITNNPNSSLDENTQNDTNVFNFEVSPAYSTNQIIFNISTDDFANETTWSLVNESGFPIANGPATTYTDFTTFQETINIPAFDVCYTFTIFDSYGDGICCNYGAGSYDLQDGNGNIIISGGQFTNEESITFKALNPLSIDEQSLESFVTIYPNPVNNILNIEVTNLSEQLDYEIVNSLGQSVMRGKLDANNVTNTISVADMSSGLYFVKLNSASRSMIQKIIKE